MTQQSHDPKILDQAYDAAQNGVALNEAYPSAHTALGFVYLLQKQYDNAIAEFERAVALDGNFVCGQMQLAFGLSQVGRVEEAVQVGERALSLKALPSDDRCLYGVASAYALAGRLEEAVALHQRLLKQFPNFLGLHLELAAIYSELGRRGRSAGRRSGSLTAQSAVLTRSAQAAYADQRSRGLRAAYRRVA